MGKKKTAPAPRRHEISAKFLASTDGNGRILIRFGEGGEISSEQALAGTFRLRSGYARTSGKFKVAFEYNCSQSGTFLSESQLFFRSFQRLACIDTNTLMVNGVRLSVATLAVSDKLLSPDKHQIEFSLISFAFVSVPQHLNPELVAIDRAIDLLNGLDAAMVICKWGLITDTELGKHEQLNNRTIPIVGNKTVPANIHLFYASADTGSFASNRLIRICDSTSARLIEHFRLHPNELARLTQGEARNHTALHGGMMIAAFDSCHSTRQI